MVLVMMITMMMLGNRVKCEEHYVGGSKSSWAPNVNFSEWSSHEHFYLGDWLYFGYDKHMYNVLEVNKTSYENCKDTEFIKNITRGGGRDVFQLTEAKTYYFLSGGGYCWQGMKVAINVTEDVAPVREPVPSKRCSASYASGIQVQALVLLISVFVWIILLKNNSY
ncbi:lamin-like protein [Abrus precatorius]|uniref:Lamin-like protein n=1 Tax=Abrus precatorius TaxID=3816 RepID=A0A8B8MLR5_ABRPR|nr:lamin-like protein [Abrus precatorius]